MTEQTDKLVPLTQGAIERKAKKIHEVDGFYIDVKLTEGQLDDLAKIKSLIKIGGDLSPYYRKSHDRAADALLLQHNVMHLHLGGSGSDALLYLVQFPDHVLFLCVDTHVHVDDIPPGKKLNFFKVQEHINSMRAAFDENKAVVSASIRSMMSKRRK
ncbi:hypothetical protein [Azospirillum thiophilum]|uniref:hypothetical protein n=1 Tax=Azospirillum thiophilum TaxID=528244 RepID=UPI0011874F4B|nr:hypothetical protein [Azospirillum thiophilum]